ncbi:STAS domain-containing protein [Luteimonas sp. SJ-92]|uniref:STAS domain-containing protein n=1 Tax=Luteimonas salinisoli TaxID=2752307 RepID=A0A853JEJ1_9GAMM|nr:STAS domain-containing protein [Luteimonas salinisoli]NZA27751.1 STAS domain-containing protein [Luteimonas salinisoli]
MPTSTEPTLRRENDTLVFSGPLLRQDAAALWPAALRAIAGARRFDLQAVPRVDSAGLALLAALAARAGGRVEVSGTPDGLAELRAAYRMTPTLAFADAR